ncbi:MAG: hypothetical protein LBK69_02815 [Syntrophomonadaceae bacterium]|nr:hypothetical protein [Syntrophomonadaceae bacterium]
MKGENFYFKKISLIKNIIKGKSGVFIIIAIIGFILIMVNSNMKVKAVDDKEVLVGLIYDFKTLTQNVYAPSEVDKEQFKNYYSLLKNAATDEEKEEIRGELNSFIINAKTERTQYNQEQLEALCTDNLIDRYYDMFDLNESNMPFNGLGGAGVIDLAIEEYEINNDNAYITANIKFNSFMQLTLSSGEKYNHTIEGTGYERYDFQKINDKWFIEECKIINPNFEGNIYRDTLVDPDKDDIVEEVIIDATLETALDIGYSPDEVDPDVINYGSN